MAPKAKSVLVFCCFIINPLFELKCKTVKTISLYSFTNPVNNLGVNKRRFVLTNSTVLHGSVLPFRQQVN